MGLGCRIGPCLFALLYVLALGLLAYGTWGPDPDPLSGIFLLPLGLPWNLLPLGTAWAVLSPAITLALLALLCRQMSRR